MSLTWEPLAVSPKMLQRVKLGTRRCGTSDTEDQGREAQVAEELHGCLRTLVFTHRSGVENEQGAASLYTYVATLKTMQPTILRVRSEMRLGDVS